MAFVLATILSSGELLIILLRHHNWFLEDELLHDSVASLMTVMGMRHGLLSFAYCF